MPDFSKLLKTPAGNAKKPPVLPVGDYPGVIKGFEITENKYFNPPQCVIRLNVGLTGWPDNIDQDDREQDGVQIELSKKPQRREYAFNPSAPGVGDDLWRLDELLRGLGVEGKGRGYEEILPELTNSQVIVEVRQYMNQKTSELGNQVGKLLPAS